MGKLAFLFAGQGAQKPGMGQSLYSVSKAAAGVFKEMEAVRPGTMADCFEGLPQRLAKTSVTQPCVYTVGLAAAAALCDAGIRPQGLAGFSLGEMAALSFAGVFAAKDAAVLVCRRGELMERAAAENPGGMAAVMRLGETLAEEVCAAFDRLWPVNYNCPGQLVVAGDAAQLPGFCAKVKQAGGMAKPLEVGGAFHTPFMHTAAEAFSRLLAQTPMAPPRLPVYANFTAAPYAPPFAETLALQMENPVRWHKTVLNMAADGFDTFVEVGPGKTLCGFVKRILPEAKLFSVEDEAGLSAAAAALRG